MKRYIFLSLILFTCFHGFSQNEQTLSLKDVLKQRLVNVSAVYNEKSVHYLKPVILIITSLVGKQLKIKVESGDLLEPSDSNCQTMLITGDLIVTIHPRETKKAEPYGMCIEPGDGAGRKGLTYSFKENKNLNLKEIARFIDSNNLNIPAAQDAVWCVADPKRSLIDINGYDPVTRLKLITKVAKICGKPIPDAKTLSLGFENYTEPVIQDTVGGMFEFNFPYSTKVHIAMFNSLGTIVRELYYNPNEKPGLHQVKFEFDYTVYTDEYYNIKLIADEKVLLTSRVDRDSELWNEE